MSNEPFSKRERDQGDRDEADATVRNDARLNAIEQERLRIIHAANEAAEEAAQKAKRDAALPLEEVKKTLWERFKAGVGL